MATQRLTFGLCAVSALARAASAFARYVGVAAVASVLEWLADIAAIANQARPGHVIFPKSLALVVVGGDIHCHSICAAIATEAAKAVPNREQALTTNNVVSHVHLTGSGTNARDLEVS